MNAENNRLESEQPLSSQFIDSATSGKPARAINSDAISKWFVTGEMLGEFIGIRFGHIRLGTDTPDWRYYSHAEFDGIGAFAEILRRSGVELRILPQIKFYPAYRAIMSALKHWPRYLAPRHPVPFSSVAQTSARANCSQPPLAVAWHVFDEGISYRIRQDSRKAGITVNTFLLASLTKAIRPALQDPRAAVPWMIPVNMRGAVNRARDTDNHTSYLGIRVHPDESLLALHHKILKALSQNEHWGNWYAFKLANCMTQAMRTALVAKGMCMSQWSLGAFSNLGEWDPDKTVTNPQAAGDWLFCPPALRIQKLAAGCVTFQGRLSLTMQAHADLTSDSQVVRNWMSRWVAETESSLALLAANPGVLSLAD
jgi:hypothetical protein